jgi:hypothetical protein
MIMKVYHRRITTNRFTEIAMLIAVLMLGGCDWFNENASNKVVTWHYSDLRIIDPVDAELPSMDIIALYIKESSENLDLRLDLLELSITDQQDLFIGLDYKPVGSEFYYFGTNKAIQSEIKWDIALEIPSTGEIKGYTSQGELISGIKARVLRDTAMDTITISIDTQNILPKGSPISIEVLLVDPLSSLISDRLNPVSSRSIPPNPARIIMGFYNTFQPYSPAQSIRMWDGAHTGPLSSRHGLRHLIENANNANINISLYDICTPIAVSGLNYLGVYQDVLSLIGRELIDVGCCFCDRSVALSGNCGDLNGDIVYAKELSQQLDAVLPVELRKQIVNASINDGILLIGGDFSESAWGNPVFSANAFNYIKNHPWIIALKSSDLIKPINVGESGCVNKQEFVKNIDTIVHDNFKKQYFFTPDNKLKELAWQVYTTVAFPKNDHAYLIHENYFGQLGHILSAAAWYDEPYSLFTCDIDLDWDQQNECILSSDNFYLTFELTGGYLAFAYYRDDKGVHQIAAPMSEVVVGLGDPSEYDLMNGVFADSSLIQGVLASIDDSEYIFGYKIGSGLIELFNESVGIRKTFRITDNSLQIGWNATRPVRYDIPLAIDPWQRFDINWSDQYYKEQVDDIWLLGIKDQLALHINSSSDGHFATFLDSQIYIRQAEDPNFEYPRGHYLPFPFAILELSPSEAVTIEVGILDQ